MAEPMSPEEYAAALADVDATIASAQPESPSYMTDDDARQVVYAINDLTRATLAVAKGIRLLAEPMPTETKVETVRGRFIMLDDDEDAIGESR